MTKDYHTPPPNPYSGKDKTPGMTEKCCPFCGSYDLVAGSWYIEDEEVEAWECNSCTAGAPKRVWNQRSE